MSKVVQVNKAGPVPDEFGNPTYAEPILGNPVSTLMESGVGNCFPGLEFDLRQLDVRFFHGLVFEFLGITPDGPDGSQGARLLYANPQGDPLLADATVDSPDWVKDLNLQYASEEAAALGGGEWYLLWIEQDGKRIEMYDYTLYQNAAFRTPFEGETCWWIIRLIEPEKEVKIALSQRGSDHQPTGTPVVLTGRRRIFVNEEGVIDPVYHPGELTSSMCSPWTHDFRDCACHYWASNHPDVALGEVHDPQDMLRDRTSADDPAQAVNFVDWMRRRSIPLNDVSAQTTIERARPVRYDPYEINLKWEELDFVLQGQEMNETPDPLLMIEPPSQDTLQHMIAELSDELAGMELTLALEYLYAYFSLRNPDEVTDEQEAQWPGLREDIRGARQMILSVALSEMTHLRWVNQVLWLIYAAYPEEGKYVPVLTPAATLTEPDKDDPTKEVTRKRMLRPAQQSVLEDFARIERPGGALDTEYVKLVRFLRQSKQPFPEGLLQLAVRIDSDGMQHYQKFRDTARFLEPYAQQEELYLRPIKTAKKPYSKEVNAALDCIDVALDDLAKAYTLEAQVKDLPKANALIKDAREQMHKLSEIGENLARQNIGVPFFARFDKGGK